MSRIITTPDINFVRGLLSLFIIFLAEYLSTYAASNVSKSFAFVFSNPPVLLVFRGEVDSAIMRKVSISGNRTPSTSPFLVAPRPQALQEMAHAS